MLSSDRRGQAQSALQAVRSRHDAIQKVERDIITLAQLFQDLEQAVAIQEPAVAAIEAKGEEVNDNVAQGNVQLNQAVDKARAARRKKWYCLGIVGKSNDSQSALRLLTKYSSHYPHHHCGRGRCCRGYKKVIGCCWWTCFALCGQDIARIDWISNILSQAYYSLCHIILSAQAVAQAQCGLECASHCGGITDSFHQLSIPLCQKASAKTRE